LILELVQLYYVETQRTLASCISVSVQMAHSLMRVLGDRVSIGLSVLVCYVLVCALSRLPYLVAVLWSLL
jgi:hypothetical protein